MSTARWPLLLLCVPMLLLGSCAAPADREESPALACPTHGGFASLRTEEAIAVLRQEVETGPLFLIPAARARDVECRVHVDHGSVWLEFEFAEDEWLRVEHDPRTAYTSHDAHFALAPGEDPVAVLQRVEADAFGNEGCGLTWDDPESRIDAGGIREHVFRGTRCHCQARIRYDASGRSIGYLFRTAC